MSEKSIIALNEVKIDGDIWTLVGEKELGTEPPKEIQLLPLGTWKHPKGTFTVNEKVIKQFILNFDRNPNDAVIDYEHRSLMGVESPAAGWIKKLVNKGDNGLWAIVEWTKKGAEYIKNREYRYLSPAFTLKGKNKVTGDKIGASLLSAAVTNTPYLEGMQPLFLKDNHTKKETEMDDLLKMLGLKEGATEQEIMSAVKALTVSINTALGLKEDAVADDAVKAIKALTTPVNEALGLKDDAAVDEAVKAIKALSDKGADAPIASKEVLELFELKDDAKIEDVKTKITELSGDPDKKLEDKLRALTEKIALKEGMELVDKFTKEGKLVPATREFDLKDAVRDPKAFTERMEKSPVIVTQSEIATAGETDHVTALSEDQKSVNEMLGVSEDAWKKYA